MSGGWTAMSTTAAPAGRSDHTAVWTGTEMIVWGGSDATMPLGTGGRYNPSTNTWTAVTTSSAPTARTGHVAVWTGSVMLIWGGTSTLGANPTPLNTGSRYNPTTNSWTAITTTNAPSARNYHSAVWTGTEMIVWGGNGTSTGTHQPLDTGSRYNPATNTWTTMSTTGAPGARWAHTAVWDGSQMIAWAGIEAGGNTETGGRYNPTTNSWSLTSTIGAPLGRAGHSAVWAGSEMIVFGGSIGGPGTATGGRYVP